MTERQFGPYQLVRSLAVGGMAEVYVARTRGVGGFEKLCALKVIHPNYAEDEQFIAMLIDEAKIAVQLQHANIAQTFDLGRVGATYYIAMELVDGVDLQRLLRRAGERGLPIDVAAHIAKEIATGLDYAHRKKDSSGAPLGIVHRDVSPHNVLVSYAGEVKLVDFGIAQAAMTSGRTAAGVIKGKYYYMSPEQAAGQRLDARSDIFSVGIVLYEMLLGQMLYAEEDLHKLLAMVRRADIPPLRGRGRTVPTALDTIVMRALARQPGARYQSAGDLAADLERFLHGYAPAFSASKLAAHVRAALADPPASEHGSRARLPLPVDRAALVTDRGEIADDHSVIAGSDGTKRPARVVAVPPGAVRVPARVPPAPRPARKVAALEATPGRVPIIDHGDHRDDHDPTLIAGGPEPDEPTKFADLHTSRARFFDEFGDHEPTIIEPTAGRHPSGQHDDDPVTVARDPGAPPPDAPPARSPPAAPARAGVTPPGRTSAPPPRQVPAAGRAAPPAVPPRARSSRRTPVPEVPTAPVPPARGAGAPISDGVPGSLRDPARTAVPTAPLPARAPITGGRLDGLDPGSLDPAIDRVTEPGFDTRAIEVIKDAHLGPGFETRAIEVIRDAHAEPGFETRAIAVIKASQAQPGFDTLSYRAGAETQPAVDLNTLQASGVPFEVAPTLPGTGLPSHLLEDPTDEHGNPIQPYVAPEHALPFDPGGVGADAYRLPPDRRWLWRLLGVLVVAAVVAAGAVVVAQREQSGAVETTLLIESSPPGASVRVDGEQLFGRTPARFATTPGSRHVLQVSAPGHTEFRDEVVVPVGGGQLRVYAFLPATPVTLRVVTIPAGAEVYIGNQVKGRTPLTINDLSPEALRSIEIRHKDYLLETRTFDWTEKTEQTVEIKLRR